MNQFKTTPSITVAIPSYNKAGVIRRAIESALLQSDEIYQLLVVDNCSTDDTTKEAESFGSPVTVYVNAENLGMAKNWNRCVELCTSEWLLILHADDTLEEGAIKAYRDFIIQNPTVGIIHSSTYTCTGKDEPKILNRRPEGTKLFKAGLEALGCSNSACSSVLVRKEAYDKLGGFITDSLSSDVEMWARIATHYDVGSLDFPTATYYVSQLSTGPQSLITRSIQEIKADWDNLTDTISLYYPEGTARDEYLKTTKKNMPYAYFEIVKANIRANKWVNVLLALKLIAVNERALLPLIRIVSAIILKKITSAFK